MFVVRGVGGQSNYTVNLVVSRPLSTIFFFQSRLTFSQSQYAEINLVERQTSEVVQYCQPPGKSVKASVNCRRESEGLSLT